MTQTRTEDPEVRALVEFALVRTIGRNREHIQRCLDAHPDGALTVSMIDSILNLIGPHEAAYTRLQQATAEVKQAAAVIWNHEDLGSGPAYVPPDPRIVKRDENIAYNHLEFQKKPDLLPEQLSPPDDTPGSYTHADYLKIAHDRTLTSHDRKLKQRMNKS